MSRRNKYSFLNYLNLSDEMHYLKNEIDLEEVAKFFSRAQQFQKQTQLFGNHLFFVIDYKMRKHIIMTGAVKNVSGYHPMDFLKGGLDFVMSIFQKNDFSIFNSKVFPATINFLQQEKQQAAHSDYVFEFTYRMKNKDGNMFTALQKGSYIIDPVSRFPLYSFGICQDITSFKKDSTMISIINKVNTDGGNYQHPVSTNYYYPDIEDTLLTKREKEILLWIPEGLSSKQISDKLNIAQNTVMNHRKSMLRKANAKNVAELIKYAIINGII